MQRVHQRIVGQRRWVWVDPEGVVNRDKPLRLGGGGPRGVVVATGVAPAEVGGGDLASEKGVRMFELAQLKLLTDEVRKGGA